ncbi:hypothetical protein IG631_00791 [Alternaria alternata]|nr:hypothetical protein IG631_00791 [Alternaria alternata]
MHRFEQFRGGFRKSARVCRYRAQYCGAPAWFCRVRRALEEATKPWRHDGAAYWTVM